MPSQTQNIHTYSFAGMLVSFLMILLFGPCFSGFYSSLFFSVGFGILLLSSVFSLSNNTLSVVVGSLLGIIAITANIYSTYTELFPIRIIGFTSSALLILITILLHVKQVFFSKKYTFDMVFGAISIFVLIGVFFALVYAILEFISPNTFGGSSLLFAEDQGTEFQHFIYYSFVTQTTLGYGDITPYTSFGQNLSIIQAIIGQFYIATLVAGLVGKLLRNPSY